MRAVRGNIEEKEERCDEFPSDSDGSAKIAPHRYRSLDRCLGSNSTLYDRLWSGSDRDHRLSRRFEAGHARKHFPRRGHLFALDSTELTQSDRIGGLCEKKVDFRA